jgi:hypothetical protein
MLEGNWYNDLEEELSFQVEEGRLEAWGDPDMSSNIFKETTKTLCALYIKPPTVTNPIAMEGSTEGFLGNQGVVAKSGLWAMMKRVQFYVIGLRECFLRVDIVNEKLSYRIVTPDMVVAYGSMEDPQIPVTIREQRLRKNPDSKELEWTIDYLDISNPEYPIYQIQKVEKQGDKEVYVDMTMTYLKKDVSGENYPYRGVDNVPFLPYSLYHAEFTGCLFDPYYNQELVKGSLSAAVLYTYFLHLSRDCAYPQRYAFNAIPSGITTTDGKTPNTAHVPSDPSSIMLFESMSEPGEGNLPPQFGNYQPGGDVEKTIGAITTYERRLATLAGINPADVQKMSGDPRSGYAIAISRSSLREAQAEYTPSFRKADLNTLEITAKMSNRFTGTAYPETGYEICYYELPKSPEELRAEREDINDKLEQGLISKIQAVMMLNPDYDRNNAIKYLEQVEKDNRLTP